MTGQSQRDRRAIVCGISADHAFALAALVAGLRRHAPDFAGDLVVYHDGLPEMDQARLRDLWGPVVFHPFGTERLVARFPAGTDLTELAGLYSPLIFGKFEMLDLLDHYDQCLWLDVDMLVQGNLDGLWQFEGLAWRPLPEGAFARRKAVMAAFADLRRDAAVPLLNGGVVGMGQALRGRLSRDDLYAIAAQVMAKTGAHSVDEMALFFMAASRGLPLQLLEQRFNHPAVAPGGRDAAIVHAIGPDKFWNSAPLQLAYPEWAQAVQGWLALGGAGYAGPMRLQDVQAASPDAALKAARNRHVWQSLYDSLRAELPGCLRVDLRSDGLALRFFIAGFPDTAHLRLVRQANERRIGVELCFTEDEILAPALFTHLDGVAMVKGRPLELTKAKGRWAYGAVVPLEECAALIARMIAAIDGVQATSRARS